MSDFVIEVLTTIVASLILALIGAWIGSWLWGIICVDIFGWPDLSYWQFYGLEVLINLLTPHRINTSTKD